MQIDIEKLVEGVREGKSEDPVIAMILQCLTLTRDIVDKWQQKRIQCDIDAYKKYISAGIPPEAALQLLLTHKSMLVSIADNLATVLKESVQLTKAKMH